MGILHRKAKPAPKGSENRSSERRVFPYIQRVAPMVGEEMPPSEEFTSVRCKDLSGGGIAVVLEDPPMYDRLVVALGVAPSLDHVIAKVVHTEVFKEHGKTRYLVGCQFLERVEI